MKVLMLFHEESFWRNRSALAVFDQRGEDMKCRLLGMLLAVLVAALITEDSNAAWPENLDAESGPGGMYLVIFQGRDLSGLNDQAVVPVDLSGNLSRMSLDGDGSEYQLVIGWPVFEMIKETGAGVVRFVVRGLVTPPEIFFKVFSGEEDLSYVAEASTGVPLFDTLMIPVGRFVLIATGDELPSSFAEPTGFELFDTLLVPVGIFFKVFDGEEDLSYVAEASTGVPLFDTLMIPVGRFVLIATGEELPSSFAEPMGFELFDTLLVPVGIFFRQAENGNSDSLWDGLEYQDESALPDSASLEDVKASALVLMILGAVQEQE